MKKSDEKKIESLHFHWEGGTDFDIDKEEMVDKINEIIDWINKKKEEKR